GPLEDARETLVDEIRAMDEHPDPERYQAFRRAAQDYADFAQGGARTRGTTAASPGALEMMKRIASANLPRASLLVLSGAEAGRVYPLTSADFILGRAADNGIVVSDATV